jgi:uncharacterized protein with HEPN domain
MAKDPTVAIRDCLAEIDILHKIADGMTMEGFQRDPVARRAAAYAIQTISEAVRHIPDDWLAEFRRNRGLRSSGSAIESAMNTSASMTPSCGRS